MRAVVAAGEKPHRRRTAKLVDGDVESKEVEADHHGVADGRCFIRDDGAVEVEAAIPDAEGESDADDPEIDADPAPVSALDAALIDALPNDDSMGSSDAHPPADATVVSENVPGSRPGLSSNVADLLHALRVTRAPDGTVSICAPPDAADALLALLRGLADLVAKGPVTGSAFPS
jgi:hypothetical protein